MSATVVIRRFGFLGWDQNGAALVIVLIISVLLSALGFGALTATNIEMKIANNYKMHLSATEYALAGIAEAARKLVNKKITGDGTAEWGFSSSVAGYNNTYTISYVTVEDRKGNKDLIFDEIGSPYYQIDSAGFFLNGGGPAIQKRAIIQLKKKPLFQFSCFGNSLIEYKNASVIDSYNSRDGRYNMAGAKKDGSLGSNGDITLRNGSIIHGNIRLGKDAWGKRGTLTSTHATVTGSIDATGHIDPNPLGNRLDANIARAIGNNDNFDISEAYLTGYDLIVPQGASVKLAAGSYYFSDMILHGGSVLKVDGDVRIFLSGGLYMDNNTQLMTHSGIPADLIIFSNATEDIVIDNANNFFGCIYAPYAKVILKNSGDFYGALWADEIISHNGTAFHYDEVIGERFTTGDYTGFELISLRGVY
jgi:hypothetical protein